MLGFEIQNTQFFIQLLKQAICWAKQYSLGKTSCTVGKKKEILLDINGLTHPFFTIAYKMRDIQRCSGNSQK